jgi:predicted nucleotidyltransferase
MKIHISENQKLEILERIQRYFPKAKIMFFGSRVRGDHKTYSDLDICLDDHGVPLELSQLARLEEEFSNSDIPFKIDIVDWNRITPDFQKIIISGGLR